MLHVENITVENDLCTSCGICEAVCPKKCIGFRRSGGQYVPQVDEGKCIDCGICLEICPGYKVDLSKLYEQEGQKIPENVYVGNYMNCYTAYAIDDIIRNNGVSGGCITSIVKELLDNEKYDSAFLVDSYKYNKFIMTRLYKRDESLSRTSKSRYVPISHANMIKYILKNRKTKVIIVATSCSVQGFLNVISKFNLNRENYLILGLFCDKTMSYNVFEYFDNYGKSNLEALLFRTKEKGGWPGQVKLEYESGDVTYLPARERMIVKDYFQLERCMYCIDKLNQFADISFGDNYTGKNATKEGTNSVIIRTLKGADIWGSVENVIETKPSSMEDIYKSQHIDKRSENYEFAKLKKTQTNISIYPDDLIEDSASKKDVSSIMEKKIKRIELGRDYEKRKAYFHRRIKRVKIYKNLIRIKKGVKHRIKTILRRI